MEPATETNPSDALPLLESDAPVFTPEQRRLLFDKLTRRVVLLSTGIVFLFCLDRGNVGLAANEICKDLQLTHSDYGTAISLFAVGYVPSQVISNVLLRRFGAPNWFAFIVFSWGCIATISAFVQHKWQFFLTRALLGIMEGGSVPGVLYYLSLFFPAAYIEEAYALIQAAIYFALPLSVPIAAGLLSTDGIAGTGWRNLLFIEGLLPVCYAIVLFYFLPKSIHSLSSLKPEEKEWLMHQHKAEENVPLSNVFKEILEIARLLPFWSIAVTWGTTIAYYVVLSFWTTLIINDQLNDHKKEKEESDTCGSEGNSILSVVLTAIPFALSGLLCFAIRTKTHLVRNRTLFTGLVLIVCAGLLMAWVWARDVAFVFGFLCLTACVAMSGIPNVFATGIALTVLRSDLRATGMGLGNCAASIGSTVLPIVVGHVIDASGYGYAMFLVAGLMVVASLFSFIVRDPLTVSKRSSEA